MSPQPAPSGGVCWMHSPHHQAGLRPTDLTLSVRTSHGRGESQVSSPQAGNKESVDILSDEHVRGGIPEGRTIVSLV